MRCKMEGPQPLILVEDIDDNSNNSAVLNNSATMEEKIPHLTIHKTQPWVSVWLLNLSDINPSTSSFRARFEFNVFWVLSDEDTTTYKKAICENTIASWAPTWVPNFLPVNVCSVESMDRERFANEKEFVIFQQKDGNLAGRYVLLLDAVFSELFELKLFPYDVQDLTMDVQYHSYPQAYQSLLPGSGDIDLAKSNIKVHEKCLSSAEWILHSVQLGFGVWKQQLRINVKLIRRWQFYVHRVVIILGLVTFVSAFTCFIPSDTIDGQLGYLSGCLLACVAYLYVLGEALPKLPFLTILDLYTFACVIYVGVLLIQSCVLSFINIGLKEKPFQIQMIFAVDMFIWIAMHLLFIIKSYWSKTAGLAALWTFPETLVFKDDSGSNTLGYGGTQLPGGCIAYLDAACRRDDVFNKKGDEIEMYQKLVPVEYSHIIKYY